MKFKSSIIAAVVLTAITFIVKLVAGWDYLQYEAFYFFFSFLVLFAGWFVRISNTKRILEAKEIRIEPFTEGEKKSVNSKSYPVFVTALIMFVFYFMMYFINLMGA